MKKFYVASSFKNIDTVRYVCQQLKNMGYIHTYDWTVNDRATTIYDLREIGAREKRAVLEFRLYHCYITSWELNLG